ncbi:hypothetical protein HDU96_009516 [Phlyctochytrium bullatum]|nr:hypothetical protein HDU96_009516 [Phlyctochytrium bullatum]
MAAAITILSFHALSALHFVTVRFGGGGTGFKAWRNLFASLVDIVTHTSSPKYHADVGYIAHFVGVDMNDITQANTALLCMQFLIAEDGKTLYRIPLLNIIHSFVEPSTPVRKSNTLFFFQIATRILNLISEPWLFYQLLPRTRTKLILTSQSSGAKAAGGLRRSNQKPDLDDIELFEAVHEMCLGIFENASRFPTVTKTFGVEYVSLLLDNYHGDAAGGIDYDLVRRGMTYAIKGLSSLSSPKSVETDGDDEWDETDEAEDQEVYGVDDEGKESFASTFNGSGEFRRGGMTGKLGIAPRRKVGENFDYPTSSESEELGLEEDRQSEGSVEDAQLREMEMRDEGDRLAWSCIEMLVGKIRTVAVDIQQAEARLPQPPNPDASKKSSRESDSSLLMGGGLARLQVILEAANPAVELYMRRERLMVILFDQIRTIGLANLPKLLDLIRGLIIEGDMALAEGYLSAVEQAKAERRGLIGQIMTVFQRSSSGLSNDAQQEGVEEHEPGMPSSSSTKPKKHSGWGVQTDPERSSLWMSLYNAIFHDRGFDYVRRIGCVEWYLHLRADAVQIYRKEWEKKASPAGQKVTAMDGENGSGGPHKSGQFETSAQAATPVKAMMAKL